MRGLRAVALLALASGFSVASGSTLLYSNTQDDMFDSSLYSFGPYRGIGDQIMLVSATSSADTARVQMYNNGGAGIFNPTLWFYNVGTTNGTPVGAQIGTSFTIVGVSTSGADVIDMSFALGGIALPKDLVFVVTIANATENLDLGLNFFEPPNVGSSSNTFFVVVKNDGVFSQAESNANLFFELVGQQQADVTEPGTLCLLGLGLVALFRKRKH